jgi:predicted acyl esterase
MNQWQVASMQPPHLAAMCVWEGAADWYRDATHHGGILSTFWANWYDMQVKTVQYGVGSSGRTNPNTGQWVCGDETFSEEELEKNRADFGNTILAHPLDDEYHRERSGHWGKINVPLLSAGNWGGQGLHLRGNVEGFLRSASQQKWLEMHGIEHWTHFYTDYGVALQKKFFGYFLKDEDTGWDQQSPVLLNIRHVDGSFTLREEEAWPLPSTQWTRLNLLPGSIALSDSSPQSEQIITYESDDDGVTFLTEPLWQETEITGPSALKLFISASSEDADIFAVLRVFDAEGNEVVFQGAIDPYTPIGQGWLRASQRKLDSEVSAPHRPYHTHDEAQPLTPGEVYELDVEILPTCIVIPAGYRIGLTVRGKDYEYPHAVASRLSNFKNDLTGCGPFLHNDPRDRPEATFSNRVSIHTDATNQSFLLLPVIRSA